MDSDFDWDVLEKSVTKTSGPQQVRKTNQAVGVESDDMVWDEVSTPDLDMNALEAGSGPISQRAATAASHDESPAEHADMELDARETGTGSTATAATMS